MAHRSRNEISWTETKDKVDVVNEYSAALAKTRLQALLGLNAEQTNNDVQIDASAEGEMAGDWVVVSDSSGETSDREEMDMQEDVD